MNLRVGTSGWQYKSWKGPFYPADLPISRWLECYVEHFDTVEVNNAFYRLPEAKTFAAWHDRTPAGFLVAVKASRYLTHIKRLKNAADSVALFVDRAQHLGDKLGPVLLQLPPTLRADLDNLDATLAAFPRGWRVAVEPRHDSWWTDDVRAILTKHNAALCLADRKGPITPLWRTADWGYIRLHHGRARPDPAYGRQALATWTTRLHDLFPRAEDVFAYFNNDARACAPRDAHTFARLATAPRRRATAA